MRWSFSNEDDGNKKGEKSNKSSIKSPRGAYFKHICREGGGDFFNLAKTIVSVLHKELEWVVEKLKYEKLEIMQQGGGGGGEAKSKKFFNCVITMHQQILFKYFLRQRYFGNWIMLLQLTLTLKMTTAQVVETSVTVNNNSPIQDYVHPDDQTQPTFEMTPGFKPFTMLLK